MTPDTSTIVQAVGWPVICGIAWRLGSRLQRIETTLDLAVNNHMAHIQADMTALKKLFQEVLHRANDQE